MINGRVSIKELNKLLEKERVELKKLWLKIKKASSSLPFARFQFYSEVKVRNARNLGLETESDGSSIAYSDNEDLKVIGFGPMILRFLYRNAAACEKLNLDFDYFSHLTLAEWFIVRDFISEQTDYIVAELEKQKRQLEDKERRSNSRQRQMRENP